MDERVKSFDFKKVDWSKYQDQLNLVHQSYIELKNDKKFMKKFNKIKKKNCLKIKYNVEKKSKFKQVSNIQLVFTQKDKSNSCFDTQVLPFS